MNALGYIIALGICLLISFQLQRNYLKGLAIGAGLIVALPGSMRISAGFFEFTIQRLIIVVIAIFWIRNVRIIPIRESARLLTPLLCVGIFRFVSMLISTTFVLSLKDFLSYAIETCLFYVILATSITEISDVLLVMKSLCIGIVGGAVAAAIQKYNGLNLQDLILSGGSVSNGHEVIGLYSHRIMLGYAMAMGVPLLTALIPLTATGWQRRRICLGLALVTAACYYSTSRGPWLGVIVAVGVIAAFGTGTPRKILLVVGILACAIMIIRPGVKDTITSLSEETFQTNTLKGKSYEYRWRLWQIAWSMISKSPDRALVGYGGLSHTTMDLSEYFGRQEGGNTFLLGYTSWDNNYAADLMEYGIIGFTLEGILYLTIVIALLTSWRACIPGMRDLMAANLASCIVYLFARSNVYIFSPQLQCQFWILVAVGTSIAWRRQLAPHQQEYFAPAETVDTTSTRW